MKKILFYSSLIWLLNFYNLKAQCNFNIDSLISDVNNLDVGNKVIQDYNGNYVISGHCTSNDGSLDVGYLVKVKMNGDTIWKKKFDYTADIDNLNDIKEMPDKSYIVLGTSSNTVVGVSHLFIANIDTNGVQVWHQQFTYPEHETAYQIQISSDNKLIILGYSKIYTQNTGDILLIKTDLSGNLIWRKIIGSPTIDEKYTSLQILNNNKGYLIGGTERPSNFKIAVSIIDTSGNVIWNKVNGNSSQNIYANTICQTYDKGYFIGGQAGFQGWLWKLDSTGTIQWSNSYGLTAYTTVREVKQLSDSSLVYITADSYLHVNGSSRRGLLAKLDKNGNLLWEKFYNRPTSGQLLMNLNGFNFTKDKGFIITGAVVNTMPPYLNLWLVKTDSLGNDSTFCNYLTNVTEQQNTHDLLKLIPNPNDGNFTLLLDKEVKDLSLIVYDVTGKEVCSNSISNTNSIQLNCTDLKNGIYIVKVFSDSVYLQSHKLIIQK